MIFFLGVHRPAWLGVTDVPLFLSYQQIRNRKSMPCARGPWALDSGGFTELSTHGRWTLDARAYAGRVQALAREVGQLVFAAIQDHMCEPIILEKTGATVEEHQRRTVASWIELRELAPEVKWLPVLQGWGIWDYVRCAEMYDEVDRSWRDGPVGVGSICRRQATTTASSVFALLAQEGLQLHAFGLKKDGLKNGAAKYLASADSLAWSFNARRNPQDAGSSRCRDTHKNCSNCLDYALTWRDELISQIERSAN